MGLRKIFLIKLFIVIFTLLIFNSGFSQVKKDEIFSFPGIIESIDKNFKFIIVNESRIFISNNTKIIDEKGSILQISDLRPKLQVMLEVLRNPDGFFAKKIVVKTLRKGP